MLKIQKDNIYHLIKINTNKIDFLQEHEPFLHENGYVWFGRYGKREFKINIKEDEKSIYIILKDAIPSTNKTFICEVVEISDHVPEGGYPKYYETFLDDIKQWFKVTNIYEMNTDLLYEKFISNKSGKEAKSVLRSMTPIAILRAIDDIEI